MKWSIFVCLVACLARFCEAGALRCPPGVTECTDEITEITNTNESSSSTHSGSTTECLAGSEWESNCHYCRCSDTGIAECLKGKSCEDGVYEEPYLCKPNTTFLRDCNKCLCLDNGLALCSMEFCSNKPQILSIEDIDKADATENSEVTEIVVLTAKPYAQNASKTVVCEANRMFVKDCNTCWCNEDGTSYFCTRRVCVPLLPDEEPDLGGIPAEELRVTKKQCRPDEVFELDCNMCRCNPDGTTYSCTRRACIETDKKNVTLSRKVRAFTSEPTKACQPGQEFRLDCNKCLCDNEGQDFSCTRIDCTALNNNQHASRRKRDTTEKIQMQCVAGSVFDRDCNVCRCTQDGNHAVCTNKSCVQQNEVDRDRAPETGFRCTPGEQFKRECNDCTCSADGRSVFCTLRFCDQSPDI